jgi:hypothetical protein
LHNPDSIGNREPRKPDPVEFDEENEPYYEVEKITKSRVIIDDEGKQHVEFEVKWEGYPEEENHWLQLWELRGAPRIVKEFIKNNPTSPLPKSLTNDSPQPEKKRKK